MHYRESRSPIERLAAVLISTTGEKACGGFYLSEIQVRSVRVVGRRVRTQSELGRGCVFRPGRPASEKVGSVFARPRSDRHCDGGGGGIIGHDQPCCPRRRGHLSPVTLGQ